MERAEMEKIQDIYQKTIKIDVSTEDALAKLEALKKRFEEVASSLGSPQSVGVPGVGGTGGVATTASAATPLVSTPTAAPPPVATTASAPPPAPGSTASAPHVPAADSGKIPTSDQAVPKKEEGEKRTGKKAAAGEEEEEGGKRKKTIPAMGNSLINPSLTRLYDRAWSSLPNGLTTGMAGEVRMGGQLIGAAIGGRVGALMQAVSTVADFDAVETANTQAAQFDRAIARPHMEEGGSPMDYRAAQMKNAAYANRIFGMSATEYTSGLGQYYTAAGGAPMGGRSDWMRLGSAGVSAGTVGAFDALRFGGRASGSQYSMETLAGVAQQGFGQVSGLERFMSSLTAKFEQLMSRGLRIDLDSYAGFMGRMSQEPGLARYGREIPEIVGQVGGAAASARQRLLSPFTNLGESASMIAALRGGGSIADIADRLSGMSAADVARETRATFGTFGAEAMMALSPRLDSDAARALARAASEGGAGPDYGLRTESGVLTERSSIESSTSIYDLLHTATTVEQAKVMKDSSHANRDVRTFIPGIVLNIQESVNKLKNSLDGAAQSFQEFQRRMEAPKAPGL